MIHYEFVIWLRIVEPSPMCTLLHWSHPEKGWIKLNTDGVVSSSSSIASIGGVFKDLDANWLCGYSLAFGKGFVFKVEARTILEGLFIAWEKGFRKIEVECDSALLVELLLTNWGASSSLVELHLLH
ncbi:hypothetical protein PVK06_041645 [Gossypium arboreum]|uniref:RNase H type-1 domain-containing protein n=1 Tax=Gossypium arboreum TaxID=29729 RepID=A0ABR0N8W3_GOSAR|nr:hypothetical protein PVK06_041645 [Gossypium arboreum]